MSDLWKLINDHAAATAARQQLVKSAPPPTAPGGALYAERIKSATMNMTGTAGRLRDHINNLIRTGQPLPPNSGFPDDPGAAGVGAALSRDPARSNEGKRMTHERERELLEMSTNNRIRGG